MEGTVSKILSIAQQAIVSTLHQAPYTIPFFTLTSSMEPLTINKICTIIFFKHYVYNVIYKYHAGKVYHVLSRNIAGKKHQIKMTTYNRSRLHDK